jgi:sugar transferase (PEP-CTERM system associated)
VSGSFNYPIRRRLFLQVLFDYAVVMLVTIGVIVLQADTLRHSVSAVATQGMSLATWLFLVGSASGIYDSPVDRSWARICVRTLLATLLGLPAALIVLTLLPSSGHDTLISLAATLGVAAVVFYRIYMAHTGVSPARSRVLIVGNGPAAQSVAETLRKNKYADIVGHYASSSEQALPADAASTPKGDSLSCAAIKMSVDDIIVAVSERRGGGLPMSDLLDCRVHGIRVWDTTTYFERALGQIRLDFVNAGWLIFGDGFRQGAIRTALKRSSDIVGALLLLFVFAPLMALTACLIPLESRGPVLYRQTRVGLNGRHFDVLKFRSMRADAEEDGRPRWASTHDERVTSVGAIIRLLRIDELPQLFNVLAGEMSLIGPRPERPYFVEQLTARVPYYAVRHSVKPGITGWAQVRYHYGASVEDSQQKLQYDLFYVKNHSLVLDCLILLETVAVVLTGKGAR